MFFAHFVSICYIEHFLFVDSACTWNFQYMEKFKIAGRETSTSLHYVQFCENVVTSRAFGIHLIRVYRIWSFHVTTIRLFVCIQFSNRKCGFHCIDYEDADDNNMNNNIYKFIIFFVFHLVRPEMRHSLHACLFLV